MTITANQIIEATQKAKKNGTDPLLYEGVFVNFADLYRNARLADKQIIFWFDNQDGVLEPYWGNVIGMTNIKNGNDVLLHLKLSEAGDMVFIPLSQAIGNRGFEIRVTNENDNDNSNKKEEKKEK